MSHSMRKLRELSDEQLVEQHDLKAKNTVVGTQYFVDELNRRANERSQQASYDLSIETQKLAKRSYRLSLVSLIATIAAVIISIISLNQ